MKVVFHTIAGRSEFCWSLFYFG